MKINFLMTAVLGLNSLLPWSLISAQNNREVADVPFSFVVADRNFPAGRYLVSHFRNAPIFSLRNQQGDVLYIQLGLRSHGNPENPSVTFACQQEQGCVLAKVTPPDSAYAYGLRPLNDDNQGQKLQMVSMISIKLKAH